MNDCFVNVIMKYQLKNYYFYPLNQKKDEKQKIILILELVKIKGNI